MDKAVSHADMSRKGDTSVSRRAIAAAAIGNALEWYDFIIYALFATYIAQAFFPGGDPTVDLIKAFIAFGLGFVIRPLGSLVIGVYADRAGRKAALTLTIMVMALGTLIIAIAPTYAAIGIGGPILLLVGRVLQGFSAGGELGGAAAFLVEHAPEGKKGRYAAWLQGSMAISNIIAALVALAVTTVLTPQQIGDWGWRLPFLFGLLIAPVGLWMRATLEETPHFRAEMARQKTDATRQSAPLKEIFVEHWPELLKGTGLCILWGVSIYTLVVYLPVFIQRSFGMSGFDTFLASLIGNVFLLLACMFSGALSDRIGRKKVIVGAGLVLAVIVHPLLWLLHVSPTLPTLIFVQTMFCICCGLYAGGAPAALSELFPTRVRSTGLSITYNVAITLFAGFAPALITWLAQGGRIYAPAWYVTAAAVCALVALATLREPTEQLATSQR